MKLKEFFILVCILIASNAGYAEGVKPTRYGFDIIERHTDINAEYSSYDMCFFYADAIARNEMLSASQLSQLKADVPKGGVLSVNHGGIYWDVANGGNWTFIITDESGHELYRTKGRDCSEQKDDPYVITTGTFGKMVWLHEDIKIPVVLPDRFKVYMASRKGRDRAVYLFMKK